MSRKRIVACVLVQVLLSACHGGGDVEPATRGRASLAASDRSPSDAAASPAESVAATSAPAFVAAPDGPVRDVVRDRASRVRADGRVLLVYVGAPWCEPCRRFHQAVQEGRLDDVLRGVTLLEFDADRDRDRLGAAGYASKYIPLFAVPAADGAASSRRLEGAIKGEGAVDFIVPRLQALLSP